MTSGAELAGRTAYISASTPRARSLLGRLMVAEGAHIGDAGVEEHIDAVPDLTASSAEIAVGAVLSRKETATPDLAAVLAYDEPGTRLSARDPLHSAWLGRGTAACLILVVAAAVPFGASTWTFLSSRGVDEILGPDGRARAAAPADAPFGFTLSVAACHGQRGGSSGGADPYPLDVNVPGAAWLVIDRVAFTFGPVGSGERSANLKELVWLGIRLCHRSVPGVPGVLPMADGAMPRSSGRDF